MSSNFFSAPTVWNLVTLLGLLAIGCALCYFVCRILAEMKNASMTLDAKQLDVLKKGLSEFSIQLQRSMAEGSEQCISPEMILGMVKGKSRFGTTKMNCCVKLQLIQKIVHIRKPHQTAFAAERNPPSRQSPECGSSLGSPGRCRGSHAHPDSPFAAVS